MLQEVRKGEELDKIKISNFFFDNNLISNKNIEPNIQQFSNGYSNLTYLINFEQSNFVLRCPPKGAVKKGHDMSREYNVLSKLNTSFNKVPKTYIYNDDLSILNCPFYVMEMIDGIILTGKEAKKRNIKADDFGKISKVWLETFVELHSLDYKSIGLENLGRPKGYIDRQIEIWSYQYNIAKTTEIESADKVIKWLYNNKPSSQNTSLIHNDYKYDNVVFKDENWNRINSILDWEMCTIGDPLMDLGTSIAYWTMSNDHPLILNGLKSPTIFEGNPSRSKIVELYCKKTNTKIDDFVFYYVYGLFKIAVIVQQIFFRFKKGLSSDPKFSKLDKYAKVLSDTAWQSIQKMQIENLF